MKIKLYMGIFPPSNIIQVKMHGEVGSDKPPYTLVLQNPTGYIKSSSWNVSLSVIISPKECTDSEPRFTGKTGNPELSTGTGTNVFLLTVGFTFFLVLAFIDSLI